MAKRRLILIGMMGSGKTTVGERLARETGWPYVDNDTMLSERVGETAREVAAHGELAIRAAESETLLAELAVPEPCVVGVAAGTILDESNRRLLANAGVVVWLRARPETLAARAGHATHRPWLDADPLAWFKAAAAERDHLYREVAGVTVEVDARSPSDTASWILDQPAVKALM